MEKIEWDSSCNIGVKLIDEQHKRIVDIINLLHFDSDATVNSETISEVLTRLTSHAKDHFWYEEKLLEEHGYSDLGHHIEEHVEYRFKVINFCKDTMNYKDSVPVELLQFIRDWWMDHILETDMKYKSFFSERGVN